MKSLIANVFFPNSQIVSKLLPCQARENSYEREAGRGERVLRLLAFLKPGKTYIEMYQLLTGISEGGGRGGNVGRILPGAGIPGSCI